MILSPAKAAWQMFWGFTLTAYLAFAGTPILADAQIYIDNAKISEFEYGLVCDLVISGSEPAPDTDVGEINIIGSDFNFTTNGTIVPAILGLSFGVKLRMHHGDEANDVVIKVKHPPLKNTGTTEQSWITTLDSEGLSTQLYTFDLPSELVTGDWTISAYKDDTLLYSVVFNVIEPQHAPVYLKQLCKGLDLYS